MDDSMSLALFDMLEEAVVAVNDQAQIVFVNSSATRLFGYERSDLRGQSLDVLIPELHRPTHVDCFARFRESGVAARMKSDRAAVRGRRMDGSVFDAEASICRSELAGEQVFVAVLRDVTARKAHERDLIEARNAAEKANQHKSMFMAGVSHELRTPLNAIIGFAEIIRDEAFGPEATRKYREYAGDIASSGVHLTAVINDLIDLSRAETGTFVSRPESFDLRELAVQCVRSLRPLIEQKTIRCSVEVSDAALGLRADPKAVRQMLINLLSNAIRHTSTHGSIDVVATVDANGEVILSVQDNGAGIPKAKLPWITTPFNNESSYVTSQRSGTGLGLAITKRLLDLHGGKLEIESKVNVGTKAILIFPIDCGMSNSAPPSVAV